MRENNAPKTIYLKDYKEPDYFIETTYLEVDLYEDQTLVTARLQFYKNPALPKDSHPPLELVGADLELLDLSLDGKTVGEDDYRIDGETLHINTVPDRFELITRTRIHPQDNTSLEGLYKSNGMFCTQCEAEGFRKITYYLDRPDVMARFTTKVIADKARYPVLLSNGNPIDRGDLQDGRHFVTWEDPFKKPCYLFALVAGDLSVKEDSFTTCSGREVALQIFVEPHDLDKVDHAMDSLKRAMRWDEEVYGREYDLDIYMIVAVSHFNMGAMENKGLNIFNTSCVLANPRTTTDAGFQRVEAVIAHEYFHNWSGNRVTCRDWFQLSLKEGFTVFRDQSFSADMGSATVIRIEEVNFLKTVQFAEDAGPMAHPVRPDSYIEINNFYTVTVYEKGAEVVRMMYNLVGPEGFRKASDLYFDRHDGQAVTCDDFVKAVEDANGIDLSQFKLWYSQAGTPIVSVDTEYDPEEQTFTFIMRQQIPPTPGQTDKQPMLIPVAVGLVGPSGEDMPLFMAGDDEASGTRVLQLTEPEQRFTFENISAEPVASVLRGFSAPVKLEYSQTDQQLVFLMEHDSDGFNRWSAGQQLAVNIIKRWIDQGRPGELDQTVLRAYQSVLLNPQLDAAMVARMLDLPAESYLLEQTAPADPALNHSIREAFREQLTAFLQSDLLARYQALHTIGEYRYNSEDMATRALKNACLSYLVSLETQEAYQLAENQYNTATNMTDQLAALRCLVHSSYPDKASLLDSFYRQWQDESLVVDQWFMVQASAPQPDALEKVRELASHPAFEITNPNKVRSLIAAFTSQNLVNFHRPDGEGYRFLADCIIELNRLNPQIASRLCGSMSRWRKLKEPYGSSMKKQLERIMSGSLSPDVYEVVSKSLK